MRGMRARLERLSGLGIHAAVLSGVQLDELDRRLGARPPGPGRLLLGLSNGSELVEVTETGPTQRERRGVTERSESLRAVLDRFARLGVAGELVLVVGDKFGGPGRSTDIDTIQVLPDPRGPIAVAVGAEPARAAQGVRHLGGGPATLLALLDEQLLRATRLRVPEICVDPRWTIVEHGVDPARHRVTESLFTLTSGGVGFRGSVEETPGFGHPLLVAAGVYSGCTASDGLLHGPDVIEVRLTPPVTEDVRVLDLRTGVVHRAEVCDEGVPARSLRFGSIVEPGVLAVRIEASAGRMQTASADDTDEWDAVTSPVGGLGALARQESRPMGEIRSVQRIVAVTGSPTHPPRLTSARRRLAAATGTGFEQLLAEQRAGWAERWERVSISVPGDPEAELGLRFALFHLWGLSAEGRELAVGARGLTGSGYAGHVFWDADVFVLPALVTINPPAAAAMVDYRLRRLAAAREHARSEGRDGARFPWESAFDGRDVTPDQGYVGAEQVPILTGMLEEHITADVAWAVVHHARWTRRVARLTEDESSLLRDTARYWTSRVSTDQDGSAHIRGVIGPDEYHERVDDNAFTNAMARWNLRTAAALHSTRDADRAAWFGLAEALVDGYDHVSGLYEQFQGYFDLQPLLVRELAEPPVAADVLAGRDVIARSQLIKQPDVLMIHHLLPDDAVRGSLRHNLDFYAPRTAHGSSLSPAVMALLHARAGEPDTALDLLRLSLRIDLDDLGGTTAAGVHIGACGGAWQAVLAGFLGARVSEGRLRLDPALPARWPSLEVRFCCLGSDVRVHVGEDELLVDATSPLTVEVSPSCRYRTSTTTKVSFVPGGAS